MLLQTCNFIFLPSREIAAATNCDSSSITQSLVVVALSCVLSASDASISLRLLFRNDRSLSADTAALSAVSCTGMLADSSPRPLFGIDERAFVRCLRLYSRFLWACFSARMALFYFAVLRLGCAGLSLTCWVSDEEARVGAGLRRPHGSNWLHGPVDLDTSDRKLVNRGWTMLRETGPGDKSFSHLEGWATERGIATLLQNRTVDKHILLSIDWFSRNSAWPPYSQ